MGSGLALSIVDSARPKRISKAEISNLNDASSLPIQIEIEVAISGCRYMKSATCDEVTLESAK